MKNLLLLSNSTMPGESYFSWPRPYITDFLGSQRRNFVFIPFAGVTITYSEYFNTIFETFSELGHFVFSLHDVENKEKAIRGAEGVIVGGGNTFQLLSKLYEGNALKAIREKVSEGFPYIGWSAGSNVACPTIKTTNDMPIVQPPSFEALGLVPFQMNPHYTEATLPNHGGESRDVRLKEFIEVNRNTAVVGLPEGTLLELKNNVLQLKGGRPAKVFSYGKEPANISPGDDISRLMSL